MKYLLIFKTFLFAFLIFLIFTSNIYSQYGWVQVYSNPAVNLICVQLKIYDAAGIEVATLVNEKQNAGSYSIDFNAFELPSGIYFYKLQTQKYTESKKMLLIK